MVTWIQTKGLDTDCAKLRQVYESVSAPSEYRDPVRTLTKEDGTHDSIVVAHSLLPSVMEPIFGAFTELMSPELALTRRQHEMINTLVSRLNECHY